MLTLAVGRPVYLDLAVNLARSFKYWHASEEIRFVIATDAPERLPRDLRGVEVLALRTGEYGAGFSPKLHLDRLAPALRTLFIDADSLCVGPLHSVFERFAGRPVSVVGGTISAGEWFGDVAATCRRVGVRALPKFNGGIYYLESGVECERVYEAARELEPRYDELGLVRLRNRPNDELLMAMAMALHGQEGIPEDGTIMAEPLNFPCGLELDVLRGRATLRNTPGHPQHRPSWPLAVAHPLVVHFLGYFTDRVPYTAEALRLEKVMAGGWPRWAATAYARTTRSAPAAVASAAKDLLRPAYRRVFGTRPIRNARLGSP